MSISSIILVDGNAPWVRSLFAAMKPGISVHAINVQNAFTGQRPSVSELLKWKQESDGIWGKPLLIPGWSKAPAISTWLVCRAIRNTIKKFGKTDLIVYTLPFYADVASRFHANQRQVYQAHDVFRFYDWNVARTDELERRILANTDAAFCVAGALSEDFRKITQTPVFDSPMAVSSSFLDRLATTEKMPTPVDLQAFPKPIVGCIGQINNSYDWDLIAGMANRLANVSFVFIGPVFNEAPEIQLKIQATLALKNVHPLGPRPHAELPSYLNNFDVCLNALRMNEHNDRRSPLRLFDYLATDKPILSTAIREAKSHGALIETFCTIDEGVVRLQKMLSPDYSIDLSARRAYIRRNTWESRAAQFVEDVRRLG